MSTQDHFVSMICFLALYSSSEQPPKQIGNSNTNFFFMVMGQMTGAFGMNPAKPPTYLKTCFHPRHNVSLCPPLYKGNSKLLLPYRSLRFKVGFCLRICLKNQIRNMSSKMIKCKLFCFAFNKESSKCSSQPSK